MTVNKITNKTNKDNNEDNNISRGTMLPYYVAVANLLKAIVKIGDQFKATYCLFATMTDEITKEFGQVIKDLQDIENHPDLDQYDLRQKVIKFFADFSKLSSYAKQYKDQFSKSSYDTDTERFWGHTADDCWAAVQKIGNSEVWCANIEHFGEFVKISDLTKYDMDDFTTQMRKWSNEYKTDPTDPKTTLYQWHRSSDGLDSIHDTILPTAVNYSNTDINVQTQKIDNENAIGKQIVANAKNHIADNMKPQS